MDGPDGEPGFQQAGSVSRQKGERSAPAQRDERGEQRQFLRRHFGEAIRATELSTETSVATMILGADRAGRRWRNQETVGVLQAVFAQPVQIFF